MNITTVGYLQASMLNFGQTQTYIKTSVSCKKKMKFNTAA